MATASRDGVPDWECNRSETIWRKYEGYGSIFKSEFCGRFRIGEVGFYEDAQLRRIGAVGPLWGHALDLQRLQERNGNQAMVAGGIGLECKVISGFGSFNRIWEGEDMERIAVEAGGAEGWEIREGLRRSQDWGLGGGRERYQNGRGGKFQSGGNGEESAIAVLDGERRARKLDGLGSAVVPADEEKVIFFIRTDCGVGFGGDFKEAEGIGGDQEFGNGGEGCQSRCRSPVLRQEGETCLATVFRDKLECKVNNTIDALGPGDGE